MISTRFRNLLDQSGTRFEVVSHDPAFTAQHLAARMHVPGREFVKAVVVRLDDRYAIAAVPAHRLVDRQALARVAGAGRCSLASEAEFRELFPDCELGAMPPLGSLYSLATYVDEEVTRDESVVVNAGTHEEAVRLRYQDLARLAKPTVGRFAVPPPSELAAPKKPRSAAKKPARGKAAEGQARKKTAGKKVARKKTARKKAARKKTAGKKATRKKTTRKKTTRKKTTRKKTTRKKTTGRKKPTARKKAARPAAKRRKKATARRKTSRRTTIRKK